MSNDDERVPVQNQARERQLADLFGLTLLPGRLGPDAQDEAGNRYEIKSTTVGGIGTGRDVSIEMLEGWRQRYWLVAKGKNLASGFKIEEVYFLSPRMMDKRLTEIEEKIRPDLLLRDKVLRLIHDRMNKEEADRVRYLMSRGATLNNPKISRRYIQQHGVRIEGDPRSRLRELVQQHPFTF